MKYSSFLAAVATLALFSISSPVLAEDIDIIEFYNPDLNHYFITNPTEAAIVDGGAAGRWNRTGQTFKGSDVIVEGFKPTCRFYTTGANSHFYAAEASECEYLKALNPNDILGESYWTYEGIAFYAQTPTDGACSPGTKPVFRLYNNGAAQGDTNHRFATDASIVEAMQSQGWVLEGVAMCADDAHEIASISLYESGGFFGDRQISFPYDSSGVLNKSSTCIGSGCSTTAKIQDFRLKAEGESFTVVELSATDATGLVRPSFSGLRNGQRISAGDEVVFSLMSPYTGGRQTSLLYRFKIQETGDTFSYRVIFRTY
ncbi:hypothetical protein ebA4929 [Aromatoleum aromaticum EbN1]|uniref:DUF5648 domain-containing protein n=1 Tax=Aromatoleum aromaticum (strain DSM 19018 / LMG 30748 / EbN1) TaxID=76114 RepID=Q5P184_AROAE|nr:hypothetical protein [Aromatoleum aromaticum]CAI08930.1 hypothetical protein ebA4929 [Aromatoleum aromaticum EbN1]